MGEERIMLQNSVYNNLVYIKEKSLFNHSSIKGHFDCFQFEAITSKISMNIHVQIFVWT